MTNETMTIFEVRNAITSGEFETKYIPRPKKLAENTVIDEEKSVKWNRDEVIRINKEALEKYEAEKEENNKILDAERDAVIGAFAREYSISKEKAEFAYNTAYSKAHGSGMYEVTLELEELLDFYVEMNSK